ncbi:hypothetical protein B0H13DRAFT_2047693 [Mycena leptocephala]|nr:hypothetical protein B0H13DRAFT_2047693 [Mycena leptocephala]
MPNSRTRILTDIINLRLSYMSHLCHSLSHLIPISLLLVSSFSLTCPAALLHPRPPVSGLIAEILLSRQGLVPRRLDLISLAYRPTSRLETYLALAIQPATSRPIRTTTQSNLALLVHLSINIQYPTSPANLGRTSSPVCEPCPYLLPVPRLVS